MEENGAEVFSKLEEEKRAFFMRRAIALGEKGAFFERSGGPFGAVVVVEGEILGEGYNQVIRYRDPTWHAEIHAIREACRRMGSMHLKGAVLYTSAEPCPMCLGAAYWAQIDAIFFASTVADALQYGNFQDLDLYGELKKSPLERKIPCHEILRDESVEVWKRFSVMADKIHY